APDRAAGPRAGALSRPRAMGEDRAAHGAARRGSRRLSPPRLRDRGGRAAEEGARCAAARDADYESYCISAVTGTSIFSRPFTKVSSIRNAQAATLALTSLSR